MAAGYTLYEVLHTLIDRVGFPNDAERKVCHDSVREAEEMGIFGNLATMMACDHAEVNRSTGRCASCGRIMIHR